MTGLRGREMVIFALHCGHSTFDVFPLPGASRSATQSRRQASCAVSAQGHGDRHREDVGLSSVSSPKHIQHFRGSVVDGAECGSGLGVFCDCGASGFGDDSEDEGWLRKTVCESSDVVD